MVSILLQCKNLGTAEQYTVKLLSGFQSHFADDSVIKAIEVEEFSTVVAPYPLRNLKYFEDSLEALLHQTKFFDSRFQILGI